MWDPKITLVYRISKATKKVPEIWNIGGTHCYKYTRVRPDCSHDITYKRVSDGEVVHVTYISR